MNSKAFSKSLLTILTKCIILIFFRGTSQDNKMAAFRESYGKLFKLRSLASDIPVIALTATATHLTRDTIVSILHMEHFVEIKESPNKTKLRYVVHCMDKKAEHEENFVWLADTLRRERHNSVRTIVYCQTIKQCSIIFAFLLYHGVLLNHVHSDIKSFIKAKECRRATLMKHFDADAVNIEVPHKCCDICAKSCNCGQVDCSSYCNYPNTLLIQNVNEGTCKQRSVSAVRKKIVEDALHQYHKELVLELLNTTANGEVKTFTNLQFMLGFSEHQISQVLENVASLFNLSDIQISRGMRSASCPENFISS